MTDRVIFETPETGSTPPPVEEAPKSDRPAWLPEQFKSAEDFAKNWQDQRAEITRLQQAAAKSGDQPPPSAPKPGDQPPKAPEAKDPEAKPSDAKPEENQNSQDDAARQVAEAANVDLAPYQQEYNTTGDVSVESRDKIAEGLKKVLGENARQIVDEFIEARKVVHKNDTQMYFDTAGGQEAYSEIVSWAAQSLPKDEVEAYNRTVNSGDRHATLFAIEALRSKFEKANGRPPKLINGSGGATNSEPAFRSSAEMVTAMRDPRYQTDPSYREQVARRLAVSKF